MPKALPQSAETLHPAPVWSLPPVVFEDDSLVAFDKPSGLPVGGRTELAGATDGTLTDLVAAARGTDVRLVCAIDAEVSGVVAWAKHKVALDFLSGQVQGRAAQRVQHALVVVAEPDETECEGVGRPLRGADGRLPETFRVDFALGPDLHRPGRLHVYRKRGGRPAATVFRVLEDFGRYVWLEVRPETQRAQQTRAHLAAIGAPVLGDDLYGLAQERLLLSNLKRGYKGRTEERPLIDRLALHESELTLRHPESREPVCLTAPLPKDLEVALRNLRKFARR